MPRRNRPEKRRVTPDPRHNSPVLAKFINNLMERGKKSLAARIVYTALDIVAERTNRPPMEVFEEALRNATPLVEVKPQRVGGATYQVPMEIRPDRRQALAMRWLIQNARAWPVSFWTPRAAKGRPCAGARRRTAWQRPIKPLPILPEGDDLSARGRPFRGS